jgi:hypothetical protein
VLAVSRAIRDRGQRVATLGLFALTLGMLTASAGGATASPSAAAPSPPVHRGVLHVVGSLADGGAVHAAGLSWDPPHLGPGLKLLSFQVAYRWRACGAASGTCRGGADSTAAPFAARRYIPGHADVGRHLRLTETAIEVVQTVPAPFTFKVLRASATFTTSAVVKSYPHGRAPRTEFVNGTPEHRTASREENFQIDPPHYATANGTPKLTYQIDAKPWHPLGKSRLFSTGTLGVGPHHVRVRTSNHAGTSSRSFGWRVVPMPAPAACAPRVHQACWYPPHLDSTNHPMRWDWQIGRSTPLERTGERAVDIYDIDGFLTPKTEIHRIHTTWHAATLPHPKVICYLDLAWEDYRPDGSPMSRGGKFPSRTLGSIYYGYPEERWVDLRQLDALKPMLDARIHMCAAKGFDAIELDDIDSFEPTSTTGFNLTAGDAQNLLAYVDNQIHREGMAVLWKNTGVLSWWGRDYSDGAVVEECYTYDECLSSEVAGSHGAGITCSGLGGATPCGWDDFTTDHTANQPTGKWVGEAEYGADHFVCDPDQTCPTKRLFSTYCSSLYAPSYGFSAVKFDVDLDGKRFFPCPNGN